MDKTKQIASTEPSDSEKVKLYNQKGVEWEPQGQIKNATGPVG